MSGKKHLIAYGLIAATILALVHYAVPGGWGWVFSRLRAAATANITWTGPSVSMPVWLLSILAGIALTAICVAAALAFKRLKKHKEGIAAVTSAVIFGIRWRWTNCEGEIRDIASFCPKCDQPVGPTAETRHGFLHLISYKCPCRKWRSRSFQCSHETFIDRVCHAIQQAGGKKVG